MILSVDQLGQQFSLPATPKRIISLVPSQTELLFALGLGDKIVGVTQFCVEPAEAQSKTLIGGTKRFLFDRIEALKPDLIIGNKEENYQEGITRLQQQYPVWMSDITTLEDALALIISFGAMFACDNRAEQLVQNIRLEFAKLPVFTGQTAAYFIWRKPYMVVGKNTFIDSMLTQAGWVNIFDQQRYPEMAAEKLQQYHPEMVLLSNEPYPFTDAHLQEFKVIFPRAHVVLVDGQMFSWYGSRLQNAPDYFRSISWLKQHYK